MNNLVKAILSQPIRLCIGLNSTAETAMNFLSSVVMPSGFNFSIKQEDIDMRCHQVDYQVIGHDIQMVEVELDPNETVIAEAGAMTYLEQEIDFEAKMGDGSGGVMDKLFGIGKRMLTGESVFLTHFTNHGSQNEGWPLLRRFPARLPR
jgi:hypothetical protein